MYGFLAPPSFNGVPLLKEAAHCEPLPADRKDCTPYPDQVYCEICTMWLNGPMQWEDHRGGKKHKKRQKLFPWGKTWKFRSKADLDYANLDIHPHLQFRIASAGSRLSANQEKKRDGKSAI